MRGSQAVVVDTVVGMGFETVIGVHPAGLDAPMEVADTEMVGVLSLPALNVGQARASR